MKCKLARDLAALVAGGDADPGEQSALAAHTARCAECAAQLRSLQQAGAAVRRLSAAVDLASLPLATAPARRAPRADVAVAPARRALVPVAAAGLAACLLLMLAALAVVGHLRVEPTGAPGEGTVTTTRPVRVELSVAGTRIVELGALPPPRRVVSSSTAPRWSLPRSLPQAVHAEPAAASDLARLWPVMFATTPRRLLQPEEIAHRPGRLTSSGAHQMPAVCVAREPRTQGWMLCEVSR